MARFFLAQSLLKSYIFVGKNILYTARMVTMPIIDNLRMKKWFQYLGIIVVAILGALNYELFVFPNDFAPAGLNGILTIIQHVFNFRIGYLSLMVNIPIIAFTYLVLDKDYALKNLLYVIVFSVANLYFKNLDFSAFAFFATDGGEKIMAAIAAGIFNGFLYSIAIRLGGSTAGMDVIATFINRKKPEFSFVWIVFFINVIVAILSFFAFGHDYTPVILCLIYSFVTSKLNDNILKGARTAAKFEIITYKPDEVAADLMSTLRHGCTVVPAKGMYSGKEKKMLICVINRMQIADFERVMKNHKDCFVIVSSVNNTYGNFKHIK